MKTGSQPIQSDRPLSGVPIERPAREDSSLWIQRLHDELLLLDDPTITWVKAAVIPCLIGDRRSIVFPPQLSENEPELFGYLSTLALKNGIRLQRDRRGAKENATADDRRKMWASFLSLGAGMLANWESVASAGHLDTTGLPSADTGSRVIEETTRAARMLIARGNRRPVRNLDKAPTTRGTDELFSTIAMARAARENGRATKVGVSGLSFLAAEPSGSNVVRYDYSLDVQGEQSTFSYFEGEKFHALGYQRTEPDLEIVINLLLGGGDINECDLWANFDEVREDLYDLYVAVSGQGEPIFGVLTTAYSISLSVQGRRLQA